MPREVEALRTLLDSRLSALELALADPKQHGSLEAMILDLARVATEEAHATARFAVLEVQKAGQLAVSAARTEGFTALEAEKTASASLRQVLENARSALKQAESMLKEQRLETDAANLDAASARRELDAIRERLEREQAARVDDRRELDAALAAAEAERARASALAEQASETRSRQDSERSALAIDLEQHRAALETERVSAATLLEARSALEGSLDEARRQVDEAKRDLDSTRAGRDAAQRDLDAALREIDAMRRDSESRTEVLSESHAAQAQALSAAHEEARNAGERLLEAIRDRDAAQSERAELQRQLQAAEGAIREAAEVNRELQAAHEARDAAEVLDASRQAEKHAESEPEVETVVDLTAMTNDEEWQLALERRTRGLEQSLRDAEARAEAAEIELERYRRSAPATDTGASREVAPAVQPEAQPAHEQPEQFRGPARGARRVAFTKDVQLQVDGNPGKLVDLSLSGAQVLTPSAINPNRLVTVTLPMAGGAITCKAKVVWSRLEPRGGKLWYRAGVQFTAVDQRALESFFITHQS